MTTTSPTRSPAGPRPVGLPSPVAWVAIVTVLLVLLAAMVLYLM